MIFKQKALKHQYLSALLFFLRLGRGDKIIFSYRKYH